MNRMLLRAEWDKFARAVFPPNVSEIQRTEMRRAFYAGAESILFLDLMMMDNLNQELIDFAAEVKAGRA